MEAGSFEIKLFDNLKNDGGPKCHTAELQEAIVTSLDKKNKNK